MCSPLTLALVGGCCCCCCCCKGAKASPQVSTAPAGARPPPTRWITPASAPSTGAQPERPPPASPSRCVRLRTRPSTPLASDVAAATPLVLEVSLLAGPPPCASVGLPPPWSPRLACWLLSTPPPPAPMPQLVPPIPPPPMLPLRLPEAARRSAAIHWTLARASAKLRNSPARWSPARAPAAWAGASAGHTVRLALRAPLPTLAARRACWGGPRASVAAPLVGRAPAPLLCALPPVSAHGSGSARVPSAPSGISVLPVAYARLEPAGSARVAASAAGGAAVLSLVRWPAALGTRKDAAPARGPAPLPPPLACGGGARGARSCVAPQQCC